MQNPDDDRISDTELRALRTRTRQAELRSRLDNILRRQIREEDFLLSDHDLIEAVIKRYYTSRADYLIDPNE